MKEFENNPVVSKSYQLALLILPLCKKLREEQKEFDLARQLLKSGTSIGANAVEAQGGISTADFSAKMSIAYKESLETKYWLHLLKDAGYLPIQDFSMLYDLTDQISRMLFTILKKTRMNQ
jgi:four helix bundle protein